METNIIINLLHCHRWHVMVTLCFMLSQTHGTSIPYPVFNSHLIFYLQPYWIYLFLFMRLWYNYIYSFPLHFRNAPLNPASPSFKSMTSLFINCYYLHICTYIATPKYSLLSLSNFTCMYVFRNDHLVQDNILVSSLFISYVKSYMWDSKGEASRRHNLTSNSLIPWLLHLFASSSVMIPEP